MHIEYGIHLIQVWIIALVFDVIQLIRIFFEKLFPALNAEPEAKLLWNRII